MGKRREIVTLSREDYFNHFFTKCLYVVLFINMLCMTISPTILCIFFNWFDDITVLIIVFIDFITMAFVTWAFTRCRFEFMNMVNDYFKNNQKKEMFENVTIENDPVFFFTLAYMFLFLSISVTVLALLSICSFFVGMCMFHMVLINASAYFVSFVSIFVFHRSFIGYIEQEYLCFQSGNNPLFWCFFGRNV